MYYLNSRYYNPSWGRFINVDEGVALIGEINGYNMYQYAFNNPINLDDSEGNWPKWAKKLVAAVAVVTVVAVAAAVTVATAGAGTVAATIAAGALKGAVIGAASGAVIGAASGVISNRVTTGSWEGSADAALNGASDGALFGSVTGTITGAVSTTSKVISAAKNWSGGGTYKSGYDSMTNHYERQVINKGFSKGNNVIKYTNDALNFADRNKSVLQFTNPSRSTMLPGFTSPYSAGHQGGWFTSDGKILTFWYK